MKRIVRAACLAVGLALQAAQVLAATPECVGFDFQPTQQPALKVFVYRPAQAGADAPVLISLHGISRRAHKMCQDWQGYADRSGTVVVVPWFDRPGYAKDRYHLGGLTPGQPFPALQSSSYAVIEEVFDAVRQREQLTVDRYRLFGHSAGAQVAHRALLLGAVPRASQVFSANAGFYTFPLREPAWPFGLGGLDLAPAAECQAFARELVVLLGEEDRDPAHAALNRSPPAMAQGRHRLARGESFYAAAAQRAQALGCDWRWQLVRVPGVAHQSEGMERAAAALIGPAPR